MALIFLGVLIIFTVSSFTKSNCGDFIQFIANDEWSQFIRPQFTVGGNAGVLSQAASEAKIGG